MAEKKHFLRSTDLSASEIESLFWLARRLKRERAEGRRRDSLAGRHVALFLEKPSVRTRISFTVGTRELGGDVVELVGSQTKLGQGEHPFDFAAVVSRYCHAIVARVFSDDALAQMAAGSTVPVINALSDNHHPCQALADYFTLLERFQKLKGLKLAFIGDGKNNVARSLLDLGKLLGVEVRIAAPEGHQPSPEVAAGALVTTDPRQAVDGVHAIYTDTWVSMGQEAESQARRQVFAGYKIDEVLLGAALSEAVVMHCLPAVRDEEIASSLLYGSRSVILDQAENRLHTQKALLLMLVEHAVEHHRHDQGRHDQRHDRRHDQRHDRPQGERQDRGPRPPRQVQEGGEQGGQRPQGERPQGERPQGERPQGERQGGERQGGERPQGERQGDERRGRRHRDRDRNREQGEKGEQNKPAEAKPAEAAEARPAEAAPEAPKAAEAPAPAPAPAEAPKTEAPKAEGGEG